MITVKEILQEKGSEIVTVEESQTVSDALRKMAEANIGAILVLDSAADLAGIFSERDYARKVIDIGSAPLDAPVREYMTTMVCYVHPENSVDECMALVTEKRCRHLPVMDDSKLAGIVSIGDLVKSSISEKEFLINQLTRYIQSVR